MLTCSACGRENAGDARFCNGCGSPLKAPTTTREERKIVTVLFVDLVGFTARAEQLDPEDVRAILTPYFQRVRAEIEACGGTVEKFIGDAVMAVFGAPAAHGDDPERAVRAALAIRDAVTELNAEDPELALQVRLGVNTGEAIVSLDANVSEGEGLVAGDVVNTAARLQTAAPVNGILVGEETYHSTKSVIGYEPVAPVSVKGKQQPIEVWIALSASAPPGERPAALLPIVGRDYELDALAGIWTRVVGERRPHLVTVFGPPGIGKTRLASELSSLVEQDGGRGIRGRSVPYGETTTYGAFVTHVKQLAGVFDSDLSSDAWAKLQTAVAGVLDEPEADEVARHMGSILGLDVDGEAADRESLFYSVRRLLEAVAQRQPTLLIFEDVHWADGGMLDLLESLASRVRDVPLLMMALARPELIETRPSWGGGLPGYTAFHLEPLRPEFAEQLAGQLFEQMRGQRNDAAEIVAAAEGNPLFIEELAASLTERSAATNQELPTTIRGIVSARLDVLPPGERAVLLDASVVGKVFWLGALEHMESGGDRLAELLDSLERRDFVRREPVSRLSGDRQFSFKHGTIRDVAYATLPRQERRERHRAAAEFLERATPEIPAAASALAHHWREAGEDPRAVDYLVIAAEQAGRGWAKSEAVTYYRQALGLIPDGDPRRREVALRQAVALQVLLHVPDAQMVERRLQSPLAEAEP